MVSGTWLMVIAVTRNCVVCTKKHRKTSISLPVAWKVKKERNEQIPQPECPSSLFEYPNNQEWMHLKSQLAFFIVGNAWRRFQNSSKQNIKPQQLHLWNKEGKENVNIKLYLKLFLLKTWSNKVKIGAPTVRPQLHLFLCVLLGQMALHYAAVYVILIFSTIQILFTVLNPTLVISPTLATSWYLFSPAC